MELTVNQSVLTCPSCNQQHLLQMSQDSCLISFECDQCHETLKPINGDCCVFCSYGSQPCPPVQLSNQQLYQKRLNIAFILSLITIGYNTIEGIVSTIFGASDETLALFGFGVDSFVEVLSGIGIAHMILRMQKHPIEQRDGFEVTALKITGFAFYILTAGLFIGAILSIYSQSVPETTLMGIIVSSISIITMYFLYQSKMKVGRALESDPIISDANCTKTCFYLSFILLGSSLAYEFLKIPYIDALGSLGIAWYAFKEGRESFEKARLKKLTCTDDCC